MKNAEPGQVMVRLEPEPRRSWSVRQYLNKQAEYKKFWHNRFVKGGVCGVGPREFMEKYGEAFLRGDGDAVRRWNAQEGPLLAAVSDEIRKVTGPNTVVYEPAAGPGQVTCIEMPKILAAGGEYFASDFDRLPVRMNRERIRSIQPKGEQWAWRISVRDVAYFKKWVESCQPLPTHQDRKVVVIIGRIGIHLDDGLFTSFFRQVGEVADAVVMFEPVLDGFRKRHIEREQNPGTWYRELCAHTELLGMRIKSSRERMNFRDPYFIGTLTH